MIYIKSNKIISIFINYKCYMCYMCLEHVSIRLSKSQIEFFKDKKVDKCKLIRDLINNYQDYKEWKRNNDA